jgi:hypothetical protein
LLKNQSSASVFKKTNAFVPDRRETFFLFREQTVLGGNSTYKKTAATKFRYGSFAFLFFITAL